MSAAAELFMEKGPGGTAIDDIVRRAGVAKGTFYLYFRDRNELLRHIVGQKGAALIFDAFASVRKRGEASVAETIALTAAEVLSRLEKAPQMITLFYKNFSWKLILQGLESKTRDDPGPIELLASETGRGEAERLMFMIVELVSSVAYNAIVLGEPEDIDAMRPSLMSALRRLLAR
jgi:Transcriptional regulator